MIWDSSHISQSKRDIIISPGHCKYDNWIIGYAFIHQILGYAFISWHRVGNFDINITIPRSPSIYIYWKYIVTLFFQIRGNSFFDLIREFFYIISPTDWGYCFTQHDKVIMDP